MSMTPEDIQFCHAVHGIFCNQWYERIERKTFNMNSAYFFSAATILRSVTED